MIKVKEGHPKVHHCMQDTFRKNREILRKDMVFYNFGQT